MQMKKEARNYSARSKSLERQYLISEHAVGGRLWCYNWKHVLRYLYSTMQQWVHQYTHGIVLSFRPFLPELFQPIQSRRNVSISYLNYSRLAPVFWQRIDLYSLVAWVANSIRNLVLVDQMNACFAEGGVVANSAYVHLSKFTFQCCTCPVARISAETGELDSG